LNPDGKISAPPQVRCEYRAPPPILPTLANASIISAVPKPTPRVSRSVDPRGALDPAGGGREADPTRERTGPALPSSRLFWQPGLRCRELRKCKNNYQVHMAPTLSIDFLP